MGSRLRAALTVVLLVATLGASPGLIPRANAEPRILTVATYDLKPFVMTKGDIKYGFTIDLLDQIGKRTGWTFNYVDRAGVQGIIRAVADGQADMAACNISITADREKLFDFSSPF